MKKLKIVFIGFWIQQKRAYKIASFSYTAYSKFAHCGLAYKYEYVDRSKPTILQEQRNFLEGACIHSIIQDSLAISRPLDTLIIKELAPKVIERVFQEQLSKGVITYRKGETKESVIEKIMELLDATVSLIKKYGLDKPNVLNEYSIATWKSPYKIFDNLSIHGSSDFIVLENDCFDLYDLKTSKTSDYLDIVQLWIYIFSLELALHRPVRKAAFLMARDGKPIYLTTDQRNREEVKKRLITAAVQIDSGDFKPNASENTCKWCNFRNQCEFSKAKHIIQDDGKRGNFTFDTLF